MTNQNEKPGDKESSGSIKNPQQELEDPAPMPRDQQGQGAVGQRPTKRSSGLFRATSARSVSEGPDGKVKDNDPAGQQGATPPR